MKEDSLWQRLNPRHSLSAAIGSVVFVVVVIAAVLGAVFSASRAEQQAQDDHERLLRQFAMQIMANLQSALATRVSVIKAAAAQIAASSDTGAGSLGRHLAAIYREFPEFSSLSVVDGRGRFATGGSSSSRSGTAFPSSRTYRPRRPTCGRTPSRSPCRCTAMAATRRTRSSAPCHGRGWARSCTNWNKG